MKNAYPHTGKWLRELFPEQTRSIPSILVWTVVYIGDVVLVFWLAALLGIPIIGIQYRLMTVLVGLYLILALVLFWLETLVYGWILKKIRQSRTLD